MKKNAFTFIELSVVMVLISIIVAGSVIVGTKILENAKKRATEEKLDAVESALEAFLITNGRLPCPAVLADVPSDSSFGTENYDDDSDVCIVVEETGYQVAGSVIFGGVPVRTLGLGDKTAADGWDNKISYIVYLNFAQSGTSNSFTTTSGIDYYEDPPDENVLIQVNTRGTHLVTKYAIYVLISHGANMSGVFPYEGSTQINTSLTQTQELGNIYSTSFDEVFTDYVYEEDFDDIVRFKTKAQMVRDINWVDVGCAGDDADEVGYTWDNASYGQALEDEGSLDCYKKCYKYGRWGNAYGDECGL